MQQTRFSEADNAYRVGCKTKRNSGFYLCRQDADTRNEHQDDGASHRTRQDGAAGRLQDEAKDHAGRVRDTSREGEREPLRMIGGSGWRTFQDETDTSGRCVQDANSLRMNRPSGFRKSCHGRAGSINCSWNAAKRTGSTVLQCSLLFLLPAMLCCAPFIFQLRLL